MIDPIQTLMNEHRIIEKVLDALEAAAQREMPDEFYERAIEFFATFADGCHHAKEEEGLFPLLEERGVPRQNGPLGVMCAEHTEGREHIERMRLFLAGRDRAGLRRASLDYVHLLRQHIDKEDNVLFQMARGVLSGEDLAKLEASFRASEDPARCHRKYGELAGELLATAGRDA